MVRIVERDYRRRVSTLIQYDLISHALPLLTRNFGLSPSLKKTLLRTGLVCATALLSIVIFVSVVAYNGRRLDRESKRYADAAIIAIASHWNEKDLIDRASPQFLSSMKDPAALQSMMGMLGSLGALKKYEGSRGEARIDFHRPHGYIITALYVARADFSGGPAQITISLIRIDGAWKILGFWVTQHLSPGLWETKPEQRPKI